MFIALLICGRSCNDDYLFEKDKCPFPSGWRAGYLETREKISRILYLTHPLMLKILKVIEDWINWAYSSGLSMTRSVWSILLIFDITSRQPFA
jgi:hypothetical protein